MMIASVRSTGSVMGAFTTYTLRTSGPFVTFQLSISDFMCGIIGYVGNSECAPILLDGLRRLEYRGYDSAGIATFDGARLQTRKAVGRIADLGKVVGESTPGGCTGISHTRWATHGAVTPENAHPHFDQSGALALVHNGVIENYQTLRAALVERGHTFVSQTDSEVLAHLIGGAFDDAGGEGTRALIEAARVALKQVIGTYGIAILHERVPGVIVGARRGSPLVLGVGKGEHFLASDVSAVVTHTREAVYLNDYEIVAVRADGFDISTLAGSDASFEVSKVEYSEADADKGTYPHFMLKEIHEQPNTVRDALRGRLSAEEATAKLGGLNMSNADLRAVERIVLSGCGTAFHAAMVGEYMIESLARLPVECEFASEMRYRNLPTTRDTLVFVISQSGETADTLAALRESRRKGHRTLGICNNVASTIARESDGGVYMHAGPEIGVAATKSFTSQLTVLSLLALLLGRIRYLSYAEGMDILREMEALPDKVAKVLEQEDRIAAIARKYAKAGNILFMGRQANYPIALEAALKLKEISYIAASGYPSAELKHGVIALVNEETPSVFIAPRDAVFEKNASNIEEVKARNGPVVAVGTEGCDHLTALADDTIFIPEAPDYLVPILATIPLQLFAYHIAVELGCDVDKPRNLAKSVTVE
jgi:glutamine---fructose-6-phosphate transaminase (isomerizing)